MLRLLCRHPYQFYNSFNNVYLLQNRWLYQDSCRTISSSAWNTSKDKKCNETEMCIDKPMKWPSGNRSKFHFHDETEAALNEQINVELQAFYYYLSMAAYFGRVDVALPGCESFFMQMHHEEHEHALRFCNYVKMRGGKVHLCPVLPPDDQDWKCPLHAFKTALQLETDISKKLVEASTVAAKHCDSNTNDFIVAGFMQDQMKSVNEMGRFVSVLSGIGDQALARFMFDKDLLDNYVVSDFNILKNSGNAQKKKCHKVKSTK